MVIAVGSTNPAKVGAVQSIFTRLYPDAQVQGADVPSGVAAQPLGEAETRLGALNRASAALKAVAGAEFGVGLEGGIVFNPGELTWLVSAVAVVHRDGRRSISLGPFCPLPPAVVDAVKQGRELGHVMDELSGVQHSAHSQGAVGYLTRGLFPRSAAFEFLLAAALPPFLHPGLYPASGT